jgi:hypothetical protein
MVMWVIGMALHKEFPNWYAKHIVEYADKIEHPEECFDCNLGEMFCYKQLECAVVKKQIISHNCR